MKVSLSNKFVIPGIFLKGPTRFEKYNPGSIFSDGPKRYAPPAFIRKYWIPVYSFLNNRSARLLDLDDDKKKQFVLIFIAVLLSFISLSKAEDLPLSITTSDHPHIRAIIDGTITIPECRISYSTASLHDIKQRVETGSAGDVIETDIVSALKMFSASEKRDWILVPVYPWREFPQHHVYLKPEHKIPHPQALRERAGVNLASNALLLWAHGIVDSSPTFKSRSFHWENTIFSSTDSAALFQDSKSAEQDYFRETRIFPIITVLAVRAELTQANPWLPEALFIAFSEAKDRAIESGTIPLPWGPEHRQETIELMKKNYWSYGVRNNPKTLSTLFEYARAQGVVKEDLKPDDVFAPETMQLIDEKGAKN